VIYLEIRRNFKNKLNSKAYQRESFSMQFEISKSNSYLLHILLIGVGIGSANYIMHGKLTWIQSSVLSISTSFIIGYPLVAIAMNRRWFENKIKPNWKLYLALTFIFFLFGAIASEVEQLIHQLVFSKTGYHPFIGGKMYFFNGIISVLLGFSFFRNTQLISNTHPETEVNQIEENKIEKNLNTAHPIEKIPFKQGDATSLISIEDIVYFEAFDNYSFIYDLNGENKLCDYSLLFLQKRLGKNFMRVHRKYIINTSHVDQVRPHSNARYSIKFDVPKLSPIISSKSYSTTIRTLIKLE